MIVELYYFWYSEKQKNCIKKPESGLATVAVDLLKAIDKLFPEENFLKETIKTVKIDNEWKEYTECSKKNIPFGSWDDYVFIGSQIFNEDTIRIINEDEWLKLN